MNVEFCSWSIIFPISLKLLDCSFEETLNCGRQQC
uniref:Uncharacterized protein n=1 Tax=Arundo donax TaxID=35708 RepID=A0A0A9E3R2_ARUDO